MIHVPGVAIMASEAGPVGIEQKWLDAGRIEVQIGNDRFPAIASLRPLYDPTNARVKL